MSAHKNDQSKAGRYLSTRVYDGVLRVSKKDAAVNRRAILQALKRSQKSPEPRQLERIAI